jgi:hypothetical protein
LGATRSRLTRSERFTARSMKPARTSWRFAITTRRR